MPSGRLTLPEMRSTLRCSQGHEATKDFEDAILDIIDLLIAAGHEKDTRVVEYSDFAKSSVGDNYIHLQKSGTVSCVVIRPYDKAVGPASYASQIVASSLDFTPDDPDPRAYDISMLMKADVVELPRAGFAFIPKSHCLTFKKGTSSMSSNLQKTFEAHSNTIVTRSVSLGTKQAILQSIFNRWSWISTLNNDTDLSLIRNAFKTPKAELLAVIDVLENGGCNHMENGTVEESISCLTQQAYLALVADGIQSDVFSIFAAINQFWSLSLELDNWKAWKNKRFGIKPSSEYGDNEVAGLKGAAETIEEHAEANFPAPLLFEPSLAEWKKTSTILYGFQANPYVRQAELVPKLSVPEENLEIVLNCVGNNNSSTTKELSSALFFPSALKRRMNEHSGRPHAHLKDWSNINGDTPTTDDVNAVVDLVKQWAGLTDDEVAQKGFVGVIQVLNKEYLEQNVSWIESSGGTMDLQPGNLTRKMMGRTQDVLMATEWNDTADRLQDALMHQRQSVIYSEVSTEAVDVTNPCAKIATDLDILLYVLAMTFAAIGVAGLLQHVHYFCHWCASYRRVNSEETLQETRPSQTVDASGHLYGRVVARVKRATSVLSNISSRILPSYEVFLILVGVAFFLALFAPTVVQIVNEYEAANYETSAVGFEVIYAVPSAVLGVPTQGALAAFVYSTTGCEVKARPELLLGLFVGFLVVSVIINLPYIERAEPVLINYVKRCCCNDRTIPGESIILQSDPAILKPITIVDIRNTHRDRQSSCEEVGATTQGAAGASDDAV